MSGEPTAPVSGWTVDTLREHLAQRITDQGVRLDQRMNDADKAIQAALGSAETAVSKAEAASEKRFEGINEFRGALADQQRELLPRSEYRAEQKAMSDRIASNADRLAALELRLTSRLDLGQGSAAGAAGTRTERRLDSTVLVQWLGLLVAAGVALFAIIHG